jgi:nucleoid DNA-binding protein
METFNKVDLSLPRYRAERHEIDDIKFFKALCKKIPRVEELGHSNVRNLIKEFNETIAEAVVENRDGVELLEGIGYLFVLSCKVKNKENVDYAKSKKYGVKVLHKNWDTDGKVGKIAYTNCRARYKIADHQVWTFKPCRKFKQTVSKAFLENWTKYIEPGINEKISALIDRQIRTKDVGKMLAKKGLEDYNEFDLND